MERLKGRTKGAKAGPVSPGHQDLLRVQLLVTESPETAVGGTPVTASAQYLNPGFKLTSLLGHLKGHLAHSGQVCGLQVLLIRVGEWMRGAG